MADLPDSSQSLQGADANVSRLPAPASSSADTKDEVERRLAGARTRLLGRLEEVGRRVEHAKEVLDVAQVIRTHPRLAVGLAFAAGALAALPGNGKSHGATIPGKAVALVGAIAMQLLNTGFRTWMSKLLAADPASSTPGAAS